MPQDQQLNGVRYAARGQAPLGVLPNRTPFALPRVNAAWDISGDGDDRASRRIRHVRESARGRRRVQHRPVHAAQRVSTSARMPSTTRASAERA